MNQEKFTEWLSSSSSSVLTLYGRTDSISLRDHVFRHILKYKKSIDIATLFSFDDEYPEHSTFGAFLNTTMAEWLILEPSIAEYCYLELEDSRWKSYNAYTDVDAMYQLLKMRTRNISGATIFVLENDDECRQMETIFWPRFRHIMAAYERPWKFILLRRASNAPKGWLSAEPSICIMKEQLTQSTDLLI